MINKIEKPNWHLYFMSMCFMVSQRSPDQATKHGCVIVSKDNSILSTGYNAPAKGVPDDKVPQERPKKYLYFEHSESNAIVNAAKHGIRLKDSIFYVTGRPCCQCLNKIINIEASQVIYGPITSKMIDQDNIDAFNLVLSNSNLKIFQMEYFDIYPQDLKSVLENTDLYLDSKVSKPSV